MPRAVAGAGVLTFTAGGTVPEFHRPCHSFEPSLALGHPCACSSSIVKFYLGPPKREKRNPLAPRNKGINKAQPVF